MDEGDEPARAAARLSLDEKAALTGGADMWDTVALPQRGVPPLRMTDGPSGARGVRFTGGTSTSLPCGTALAATWNRALVGRVGELLAREARSKGAHLLLAPTVNVHRHPLGGRSFECFSEDPYLSAEIADAYIRGVQSRGVGCAVKHLVANDQETDRMEISVDVDERTLREIYLPAFETAVRTSGVWAVMAAYNRLHGIHCSEHAGLLEELLRDEWGFEGMVVSDWFGTYSTLAVSAGLDLEMPGPARYLGSHLAAAVRQGEVDEQVLERAAGNVLGLLQRATGAGTPEVPGDGARTGTGATVGAVPGPDLAADPGPAAVALQAASEGIVLLHNRDVLPLDGDGSGDGGGGRTLAVVGPKADWPDTQGGGSAHVDPPYEVSPLEGIRARAGDAVTIVHEPGVRARAVAPLTRRELRVPGGGERGLLVEYFAGADPDGPPAGSPGSVPVLREVASQTRLFWAGPPAPGVDAGTGCTVRGRADLVPERSGTWTLRMSGVGPSRLSVDGQVVIDNLAPRRGTSFFGRGSVEVAHDLDLEAGRSYRVELELFVTGPHVRGISGLALQARAPEVPDAGARAVAAATSADAAVVVVGEDAATTEGDDRTSMDLPAEQVELVREVAAANPATVVVLNTGAPVTTDWVDEVAALVQLWYPGQEAGTALARVLFGDADPAGRLPTTFPRRIEDTPAHRNFPGSNGRVHYGEGLFVGYRHYDSRGVAPRFCFGHGLSYTRFAYGELEIHLREGARPEERAVLVAVDVTNVGDRPGREVVQVYVGEEDPAVVRPEQELKQFAAVDLAPGESRRVDLELPWRAFAHWAPQRHRWTVTPGGFEVRVGSSSRAIRRTARLDLDPGFAATAVDGDGAGAGRP